MARSKTETAETVVTNENFGDILAEGLKEAVEIHEGRRQPDVVHSYPITAHDVAVEPAPVMGAEEIRKLRESLKLSQPVFAQALNVSPATDRAWEQAKRIPDGPSLRLLQIVQRHPGILLEYIAVRQSRARVNGRRTVRPATRGRLKAGK